MYEILCYNIPKVKNEGIYVIGKSITICFLLGYI